MMAQPLQVQRHRKAALHPEQQLAPTGLRAGMFVGGCRLLPPRVDHQGSRIGDDARRAVRHGAKAGPVFRRRRHRLSERWGIPMSLPSSAVSRNPSGGCGAPRIARTHPRQERSWCPLLQRRLWFIREPPGTRQGMAGCAARSRASFPGALRELGLRALATALRHRFAARPAYHQAAVERGRRIPRSSCRCPLRPRTETHSRPFETIVTTHTFGHLFMSAAP